MQNEGRAGQKGCAAGFSSKFPSILRRKSSGPNGGRFFRHPRGREARSLSGRFRVRFWGLADPVPSLPPDFQGKRTAVPGQQENVKPIHLLTIGKKV